MPLIGLIGGVTIITVAALVAFVKLTKWHLQTGTATPLGVVRQMWAASVFSLVILEVWPGLSTWLTSAVNYLYAILPTL